MRAALVAMNCPKGDLEGNLARHVEALQSAAVERCDVAVFPELSLTGSLDPTARPDGCVELDSWAVSALAEATATNRVAAVFGIAESSPGGPFITQVFAHGGAVEGYYRKRLLQDEPGYRVGGDTATFELAGHRFGLVICAEGGADFSWSDVAAGGAAIALFCSAPGLYGRRTDAASWRAGHDWWVGCGLGDARRQARRLGLWVAMATQAGSTEDEDFPGLAALVDPGGEVVARTAGWEAETLYVDIPLSVGG